MSVNIEYVTENSICDKKGIKSGDRLLKINGNEINDVLDYRFYLLDSELILEIENCSHEIKNVRIEKNEYDDIGLEFKTFLMSEKHRCRNKCIFCFIDQLPEGLRENLYFKDDDSRLSFLFGNYITLTNLTQHDAERIVKMHISPVNVSVHTMNPELRAMMMGNKNAGNVLGYLKYFAENNLKLNTQLVLCPDINDEDELENSLEKLAELYPSLQSIAAVPVGLTKHRQGLVDLKQFSREKAAETIDIIEKFNEKFIKEHGVRIAFAADEFYLKAEREIPDEKYYGDFCQLENGVGLCADLKADFYSEIELYKTKRIEKRSFFSRKKRVITMATGEAAYSLIRELSEKAMEKFGHLRIDVIMIKNKRFGENITVAGLITGEDFYESLKDKDLGQELLIPAVSLRNERDMFLDDMTLSELSSRLNIKITAVENSGVELLAAMLGE